MNPDTSTLKNPPVQISDEFVMPKEVAVRLIVCNKISNKLRKRCKRAMQTSVISRAPILQEMKLVPYDAPEGTSEFVEAKILFMEQGGRVYDTARAGKTVEQALSRLVTRMSMKQLVVKLRRIPAKRKMAQWVALNGADEDTRKASEQRVNILDEMRDAIETEIERRTQ